MPTSLKSIECGLTPRDSSGLLAKIDEVERWWQENCAANVVPWQELAGKLHDLRPELLAEFQCEEAREQAVVQNAGPHASRTRLEQLIDTHAVLMADLDQLVMRLRMCEPGQDGWSDAEAALLGLLAKLGAPR